MVFLLKSNAFGLTLHSNSNGMGEKTINWMTHVTAIVVQNAA